MIWSAITAVGVSVSLCLILFGNKRYRGEHIIMSLVVAAFWGFFGGGLLSCIPGDSKVLDRGTVDGTVKVVDGEYTKYLFNTSDGGSYHLSEGDESTKIETKPYGKSRVVKTEEYCNPVVVPWSCTIGTYYTLHLNSDDLQGVN